jgi:GAF domain-containing protein
VRSPDRDTVPIAIPIIIREQVLGVVEWEISESEFNQNQVLLAEELAARLAVSLDNARFVQTGRQTAENERIINTISAKISGQTDIEQILQTAIQEVGQALRAPQVNINLQQSTVNDNNGHHPTSDNA